MSVIRNFIDKPVIKVFTGMRRCGKSSLLKLTYEEILKRNSVDEKNILYFNFESLEYESLKDFTGMDIGIHLNEAKPLFERIDKEKALENLSTK